jgi:hypothetical protein
MDLHRVVESELFTLYLESFDFFPRGYNFAAAQLFSKLEKDVAELREMIFEVHLNSK